MIKKSLLVLVAVIGFGLNSCEKDNIENSFWDDAEIINVRCGSLFSFNGFGIGTWTNSNTFGRYQYPTGNNNWYMSSFLVYKDNLSKINHSYVENLTYSINEPAIFIKSIYIVKVNPDINLDTNENKKEPHYFIFKVNSQSNNLIEISIKEII